VPFLVWPSCSVSIAQANASLAVEQFKLVLRNSSDEVQLMVALGDYVSFHMRLMLVFQFLPHLLHTEQWSLVQDYLKTMTELHNLSQSLSSLSALRGLLAHELSSFLCQILCTLIGADALRDDSMRWEDIEHFQCKCVELSTQLLTTAMTHTVLIADLGMALVRSILKFWSVNATLNENGACKMSSELLPCPSVDCMFYLLHMLHRIVDHLSSMDHQLEPVPTKFIHLFVKNAREPVMKALSCNQQIVLSPVGNNDSIGGNLTPSCIVPDTGRGVQCIPTCISTYAFQLVVIAERLLLDRHT
jgi:hypothetical protein